MRTGDYVQVTEWCVCGDRSDGGGELDPHGTDGGDWNPVAGFWKYVWGVYTVS